MGLLRASRTALLALIFSGCGFAAPDLTQVPDKPTFDQDVKPILDSYCNLCHGDPPDRGAPSRYRLDVYDDVGRARGARSSAQQILKVVEEGEMPPAARWGDGVGPNATEVLRRWAAGGTPR